MTTYEYVFPKKISNNVYTYEFICVFYKTFYKISNSYIYINFENVQAVDVGLMAPLGLILEKIKLNNNKIFFRKLPKHLWLLFLDYKFTSLRTDKLYTDIDNSKIEYRTMSADDIKSFHDYIVPHLNELDLNIEKFKLLERRIKEVFINVKTHARDKEVHDYRDKEVFCSGQYKHELDEFNFNISNQGITIKENLKSRRNIDADEVTYIDLALKMGFSTKDLDTPGGMGLYYLKELVSWLEGKLIIVSGKVYYELDYGEKFSVPKNKVMEVYFPGTSITIIFNVNQLVSKSVTHVKKQQEFTMLDLLNQI